MKSDVHYAKCPVGSVSELVSILGRLWLLRDHLNASRAGRSAIGRMEAEQFWGCATQILHAVACRNLVVNEHARDALEFKASLIARSLYPPRKLSRADAAAAAKHLNEAIAQVWCLLISTPATPNPDHP